MSLIAGNLDFVARLIDSQPIHWAICADVAAHLYGDRRPINDIDMLVGKGQLTQVVQLLQRAGKAVQFDGQRILWRGIKVTDDLSIRRNGSSHPFVLDALMLSHLRRLPLLGAQVAVIAPEDLLVQKLLNAYRPEPDKFDAMDIAAVVRRQRLDLAYLCTRLDLVQARGLLLPRLAEFGIQLP